MSERGTCFTYWMDPAGNVRRMDTVDQEVIATTTEECTEQEACALSNILTFSKWSPLRQCESRNPDKLTQPCQLRLGHLGTNHIDYEGTVWSEKSD